ncbi:MAG TPA: hypothetical protein DE061_05375 [Clostridiales bacterium]|nr:hypothetical protein [Clostridiales bacterium]
MPQAKELNLPLSLRGNEVTVRIKRSEMRFRLDLHATFVVPCNDKQINEIQNTFSICAVSDCENKCGF